MRTQDKHRLYQIVVQELKYARRRVEDAIFAAHNGRPDGHLVTADNMWLFRQYRNSVSPSPAQLVQEALEFVEDESCQ